MVTLLMGSFRLSERAFSGTDTDTETGIRFWEKENIKMKGKGRHFFRKIEPVTSIFVDHEG